MAGKRRAKATDEGLALGTDKLYFKIGEVSEIVGVAPHVLRYWETEFSTIRPQKSRTRQRVYRRKDVATLLRIKQLLYVDKFTIAGARKQLREQGDRTPMAAPAAGYLARRSLDRVRAAMDDLEALLQSPTELDPAGADPADYLRQAGGAEAVARDRAEPSRGLVDRPPRTRR